MRKISLLAGLLAVTLGGAAVSTTAPAFAACLNPDAGLVDLTHNAMQPGAGWGYDKDAVDRELAKGNKCAAVTQQSQPVTGDQLNDFKPLNNQTRNGQNEYN